MREPPPICSILRWHFTITPSADGHQAIAMTIRVRGRPGEYLLLLSCFKDTGIIAGAHCYTGRLAGEGVFLGSPHPAVLPQVVHDIAQSAILDRQGLLRSIGEMVTGLGRVAG